MEFHVTTSLQRVVFLKHPFGILNARRTLEVQVNQRVPNEHVARETKLDHVGMNLNPWGQVQSAFGARVKQEGEGVLVGLQETTSHGGVKGEGLGRR
ncbi:putative tubulin polymerization-promoting protein [Sesbania bispinosa]|nr:putative tubulin polymerization-promoting protein [Sesbania bispinosa]